MPYFIDQFCQSCAPLHVIPRFIEIFDSSGSKEVTEYSRLIAESREQAINRMAESAKEMGANAIVGVRFVTSMIATGASEILAYGTAVVLEDAQ